ncbi:MAG: fumarate hydratase C-terminal domain-containing protein [Lentisphaeria bacterium]|nr:fumarate hydratase C-terminal domain-containing protein [Lentisphaeria bacterium]MBR7139961.1 fumarate hydratase C-terminal domain-containing protein [Lentisphaeria bacterium]
MRDIKLPMSAEDARSLELGEMITVSGLLFTGRSRFHIRAIEENLFPPIDYEKVNCFFHVGPVMKQEENGEWQVVSCEPTSSIRFERYGADVVRKFNLRTLIGKTTMGPGTAQALKEVGGVYLSKIGLSGNALRGQVKKVHEVHFLDELGKTEATWIYEVENFGPFFVAMDTNGRNYFEELAREADAKMPGIEKKLGIPEGYDYTEVNG